MRITTRILTPCVTVALVLPATAAAKLPATVAPPGNSAISEYLEVVPGDTGAMPPRHGGAPSRALTPGQSARLQRLGADGRTLAAVVAATAPPVRRASGPTAHRGGSEGTARRAGSGTAGHRAASTGRDQAAGGTPSATDTSAVAVSDAQARSAASLLLDTAAGAGGGLGLFMPAMLLAGAIGLLAHAVRQRRTGS